MKHLLATSISIALLSLGLAGCGEKQATKEVTSDAFVTIQGQDLIKPDGTKLFIMGTNLGNWLNPEGYMFKFNKTNSGRFINEMFCQLVGPDFTADFWKAFKDNYERARTSASSRSRVPTPSACLSITNCLQTRTIWG